MYINNERKEQKSKRADPNRADILHHSRYYKRDVFIGRLIDRRLLVIYNLQKGFINNNGSERIIYIYIIYIYLLTVYKYNNIVMTSVYTAVIFEGKLVVIPEKEGCYWKLSRYKKITRKVSRYNIYRYIVSSAIITVIVIIIIIIIRRPDVVGYYY